jgi:hypothetical protein
MMSEVTRGQTSRKIIRTEIENSLGKYLPAEYSKLANIIAYDFNLSPYTVRYTYLPMFLDAGIIELGQDGLIHLTLKGRKKQEQLQQPQQQEQPQEQQLQPPTEKQLQLELEKENERRAKLGLPRVSYEEWCAMKRRLESKGS